MLEIILLISFKITNLSKGLEYPIKFVLRYILGVDPYAYLGLLIA